MALILASVSGVFGASDGRLSTYSQKLDDGRLLFVQAMNIDGIGPKSTKMLLNGKANVRITDTDKAMVGGVEKIRKIITEISAQNILIERSNKTGPLLTSSIKSATMTGSPVIIQETRDASTNTVMSAMRAVADKAIFEGENRTIKLTGNVKITDSQATVTGDSATYDTTKRSADLNGNVTIKYNDEAYGLAQMTADHAVVNLGTVGPDDSKWHISGSPATITAKPEAKPKQ